MDVRLLETPTAIAAALSLMRQLRPRLAGLTPEAFAALVALQMADGYRLAGGFDPGDPVGEGRAVVLAGFRPARTLSAGPHLFVDDLVTDAAARGRGAGRAMIGWLRAYAAAHGLPKVCLDSRDTARGFYERVGFTFSTAIPCWIPADGGNAGPGERR